MFKQFIAVFAVLLTGFRLSLAQDVLDKIVAVVDDNIILRSELQQFAYTFAIQSGLDPSKDPEKFDQVLKQTLDNLITQKVLLVKAKEDSVTVSDEQVDQVLEEQVQQMVRQLGSESKLEDYFGSPLRQIRREFREEVEERLLVQKLQDVKKQETQISRKEIENFYSTYRDSLPELKEGVRIRHILVHVEPSQAAIERASKRAEQVLAQLRQGENFAELAKQISEDPGSAAKGGDLGLVQRGDMVKEFEQAAFALEPGQISNIVRSQFGLHIIKLERKIGEKIRVSHILFRLDTSADDESATVERLKALRQRILDGELTFEDAAKQFSKDDVTAEKGGDLGFIELDEFQVPAFKAAVEGLNAGEISEPVKTRFGFHLIKVDERRARRKLNIADDWEQIESWALNLKRTKEFQKYVAASRNDVYIELKTL